MLKSFKGQPLGFSLCLTLALVFAIAPDLAHAGGGGGGGGFDGDTIGTVLCNVINWFTGPVGKGIATLAIIVIGVGALMGKVSWGMAIIVGVGVAVIFGAEQIVDELGGTNADNCQSGALNTSAAN